MGEPITSASSWCTTPAVKNSVQRIKHGSASVAPARVPHLQIRTCSATIPLFHRVVLFAVLRIPPLAVAVPGELFAAVLHQHAASRGAAVYSFLRPRVALMAPS